MSFMLTLISILGLFTSLGFAKSKVNMLDSVPGEFVVRFKSYQSMQLNTLKAKRIGNTPFAIVKRPTVETMAYAIQSLTKNSGVAYAEPNYIYRKFAMPNDPSLHLNWGIKNFGQIDSDGVKGVVGMDADLERVWEQVSDTSIIVAVIDTGIDYTHPDLRNNIYINEKELYGTPGVDDDGNGYVDDIYGMNFSNASSPTPNGLDDQSHGTHCAGVIGAEGNNGIGIAGVNWNVKMLPVKFLSADGSGSLAGAIAAIDYAVNRGAKVLSNSWGGNIESQALYEAVLRTHEKGTLFVAASGNDGKNNDQTRTFPATYDIPNVVSVGAINNRGALAGFSNYGKRSVHLAAPGENIYSTVLNNRYASYSGTSMAAPFVSGVAALTWGVAPQLTNLELKERLIKTVRKSSNLKNRFVSGGMVSAYNAVMDQEEMPNPDDPITWATVDYIYSTPHPYLPKQKIEFEVEVPGAKKISLYFAKFSTEANYDKVEIFDKNGVRIDTLSGMQDDIFTTPIEGSYARVVFTSDDSVQEYGFDLTKIAYQ